MKSSELRDSLIAAFVTFAVVGLVLVWLLVSTLHFDAHLASAENPQLEEDEVFLDPELLVDNKSVGEPDAATHDAPAPEVKGSPAPAPEEQPRTVVSGDNTVPSQEQKLVTSRQESAVETVAPDKKKEEEKVATSMTGKFGSKPGSVEGKFDAAGSSSDSSSTGITGRISGRRMLNCPKPDVALSHKTTVTVSITVDADGNVQAATASGATTRDILRKCEQAALKARWSEKKGAAPTHGTITFNIIPK